MTEPIDIIRQLADNFAEEHKNDNFAKMLVPLRETMATLHDNNSKRTFLRYIKTNVEHELELHILKEHPFGRPEKPCGTEVHDKQFIYYIDQELSIIDTFEQKEKKNLFSQVTNEVLMPSLLTIFVAIGTIAYNVGYSNSRTDFAISTLGTTNVKTEKVPNTTKTDTTTKGIKNRKVNIPIGKP